MGIVELLSRLWRAARSRDNKTARELLDLARHHGWDRQVAEGVARLPSRDAAFVQEVITSAAAEREYTAPAGEPARSKPALVGAAVVDGIAGVTRDAASGFYFPASSAEWTTFLTAIGLNGTIAVPDALHGFQDASGNITDQIGAFPLTASGGAASYQQTEAGYTRKAVVTTEAAASIFATTSASLPDPASASYLGLIIAKPTTPTGGSRQMMRFGSSAQSAIQINTAGRFVTSANGGGTIVTSTAVIAGSVLPLSIRYNRTASTLTGFTNAEKLSPAFSAASGKRMEAGNTCNASTLYAAHWFVANAEVSDANWKLLLQGLGHTITWS